MAKQVINVGTSANDGTGDKIRVAFQKTNANFTELYDGKIDSVVAGTNVTVDNTDPLNPIVSATGGSGTVTSVGLTMPTAFSVANSPVTTSGTIAVTAIGTASQYIRGDGQLATLPSGSSGGSSVNYYLNGSVAASVATYKQMSNTAIIGTGTDFAITGNGLIAQFLTDAGNPNRLEIPSGAWNFEMFFSMSSGGGSPKFYVELLKYNGATFTSIASSGATPETISGGAPIDLYLTSLAVSTTSLLVTDRLAIRVYIVDNSGGRTATLHTEDSHLCEIITTFAGGVTSLNGLTANTQNFDEGTSGTDFNISSVTDTHTFNLPDASATARGVITTGTQTIAGAKTFSSNISIPATGSQLILSVSSGGSVSGLDLATYPSLTELATVKGVTSAIQTQLNNKQFTLFGVNGSFTIINDSTTYYFSPFGGNGGSLKTVTSELEFNGPVSTLNRINLQVLNPNGVVGTSENVSLYFRNITTSTSTLIGTFQTNITAGDLKTFLFDSININIPTGNNWCLEIRTPAWVINPTNTTFRHTIFLTR